MWFRSNASVVFGSIFLALVLASPLGAQQGRWEESISRSFSFQQQGNYAQAVQWAQEALRAAEATFGSEHINVATSLNALAVLYKDQGKYAEAEPLFRRALAIWEKVRGSGESAEAEPLYHGALVVRKRAMGAGHLDVANLLNNLAQLYAAQGKYADAEPLYQRSLAIREKTLGSEHSFVADSLNNLAGLYKAQGKYAEAEPLYKRALAIQEKALGPEQLEVANTLDSLALLYRDQRQNVQAEPLFRRALAILEKALGPGHLNVAILLNNLAGVYKDQSQYAEAESLYQRAMSIEENVLGPEHPITEITLMNLGILYYDWEQPRQAEVLLDRSMQNLSKRFDRLSEKERLGFLDLVTWFLPIYFSFCYANQEQNPALVGKMYDALLWEKGLLASTEGRTLRRVTWRDVQKALKEGEAAVELVRFPFQDREHASGPSYYAALVVTPESRTAPSFVLLGDGKSLAGGAPHDPRQPVGPGASVGQTAEGVVKQQANRATAGRTGLLEPFWEPLEPALAKTKRIFLSPDHGLNQAAVGVIPVDQRRLPAEMYDLRIVSSTRDLLRQQSKPAAILAASREKAKHGLAQTERRPAISRTKVDGSLVAAAERKETATAGQRSQLPPQGPPSTAVAAKTGPALPASTAPYRPAFAVQVGAYADRAFAEALASRLAARYQTPPILSPVEVGGKTVYRVRIPTSTKAEAEALADRLRGEEKSQVWIVPLP